MTLSSLICAHDAYIEQEVAEWNRTRHLMFVMVRMWGDPKKQVDMFDLLPLPGDEKSKVSDEDFEKDLLSALQEFKKIHNMN